jgi:hypothetical protein
MYMPMGQSRKTLGVSLKSVTNTAKNAASSTSKVANTSADKTGTEFCKLYPTASACVP